MQNRLDEAHLFQISLKRNVWTADRAKLSQGAKEQISEMLISNTVLRDYEDEIFSDLNHWTCRGIVPLL